MIRDGYTISHRATWHHPIVGISRPLRCLLWKWMIDEAWFKDADGLKRGQFRTTMRQLADVVGMSISALARFKSELLSAGMVEVSESTSNRLPSTWTIVNYDRFQAESAERKVVQKLERNAVRKRNAPLLVTDGVCDDPRNANGTHGGTEVGTHGGTLEKQNPRIKTPESKTNNQPASLPPWMTGPQPASAVPLVEPPPAKSGKRKPKPSVRPIGDWPGIEVDQDWSGYEFPTEFSAIWAPWLVTQRKNPNVKAIGKRDCYRLILEWLHDGLTPADILKATADYLRDFFKDPTKTHCEHPTTFYSRAHPTLPDRIDAFSGESIAGESTSIRDRWKNAGDAFRECASLSLHIGVELPTVPDRNYGPEWEDVEEFHPLILEYATDRSGFKTAPDDLAQRIEGAQ